MDDEGEGAGFELQKITIVDECGSEISSGAKLSHKQWRARLKRERRRNKRREVAKELAADKGIESLVEATDEEFEKLKQQRDEAERAYLHAQWLEREKQALDQWQRTKERERVEKQNREEQEKRIKEEWEAQQKEEKEEQEKKDEIDKEKKSRQEDLLRQATANENKEGNDQPWHNPIVRVVQGKERDRCPFFAKTAACRFGDRCSRTHPETESSTILLFRGMYSHFELEQGLTGEEYDTDLILEYDDSELYQNFRDFYEDIVPEFKAIGRLVQVKVCCNYEPHLRGNVYIQYRREDDAASAFAQFNGRFYGGKQLSCEYVTIPTWKSAVCGLFGSGRCPKGRNCNFFHVFKNPGNEFWESDRNFDRYRQSNTQSRNREWSQRSEGSSSRRQRKRSRSRERRRSRSQERRSRSRSPTKRNRSTRHTRSNRSRSSSKDRHHGSNRKRSRNYRSRSRSRSKSKTRDRQKSRKKRSDSRSLSRGRSRSPKSKSSKKHSRSRSYSRGRSRSSSKSEFQQEEKQSKVKENCVITDNIGESEKQLVTESGENNERLENSKNGKVLETEEVKSDLKENSNSSDSEKSSRSHHHKDKKHKHKKHKHKKHKKITLEWIEAS
ncbi:U2 small nuclear ribonucleoprotein auxiliary factor 35 kDa subunit-related protein 2-like isoform X2 [Mizuhopecten yessoensis]|uniref:U2 small nuclear ribonucleoprotein auxiliary factor 35 kDa subunit-related protein 2-like isoform X2 n=1 Tax=Mizuhopecten yessoensis TaxID=6573 RepID=UPI000B4590CD|nr:U2 small nuclear ribonucleoprotein auxiliary factor 35 kDa subunit-related protein 2-like isoform X2 [Mizuhopecten yessoensis]